MSKPFVSATGPLVLIDQQNGLTLIPSSPELTRLHYFDGKFLRAEDLDAEQSYLRRLVAMSNRAGGPGVVNGFEVEVSGDALTLTGGLAIDPAGRVLMLPEDRTVSVQQLIDRSRDIQKLNQSGALSSIAAFEQCQEVNTPAPATDTAGRSWYLITIAHAEALCGEEDVYGKLCEEACVSSTDRPWIVEGVVLRAIPFTLTLADSTAVKLSRTHLRSLLASAFFATEAAQVGSLISGAGLQSSVWCQGAPALGGNEVPLAVLVRDGSKTLFVDEWTARRERMDGPPKQYWQWRMAMRPWSVYMAQILQFQCQLHALFSKKPIGLSDESDPCIQASKLVQEAQTYLDTLTAFYHATTKNLAASSNRTREKILQDAPVFQDGVNKLNEFQNRLKHTAQILKVLPQDRYLIQNGIVELPSAGYLPVVPGTVSVNDQVRKLLGEGVDLQFCIVRPDYVAHALEEAQHMERISLLEGLDHPDRKPKVDILVPDGKIAQGRSETGTSYEMRLTVQPVAYTLLILLESIYKQSKQKKKAFSANQYNSIFLGLEKSNIEQALLFQRYEFAGAARSDKTESGGIGMCFAGMSESVHVGREAANEGAEITPAGETAAAPAPAVEAAPAAAPAPAEEVAQPKETAASGIEMNAAEAPADAEKKNIFSGMSGTSPFMITRVNQLQQVGISANSKGLKAGSWLSLEIRQDPFTLARGSGTPVSAEFITASDMGDLLRLVLEKGIDIQDLDLESQDPQDFYFVTSARFSGQFKPELIEEYARANGAVRLTGTLSGKLNISFKILGKNDFSEINLAERVVIVRIPSENGDIYKIEAQIDSPLLGLSIELKVGHKWMSPSKSETTGDAEFSGMEQPRLDYLREYSSANYDKTKRLFLATRSVNKAVLEASHPAHVSAISALRLISKATDNPNFSDGPEECLFPPPRAKDMAVLASLDWVLFHRRRERQCQQEIPAAPAGTRTYALYQIELGDKRGESGEVLLKALEKNDSAVLARFKFHFIRLVEFAAGVTKLVTSRTELMASWNQQVGESGPILGGVIGSRGEAIADGIPLAMARIDGLVDTLGTRFQVDRDAEYQVLSKVPEHFDTRDSDGVIILATGVEKVRRKALLFYRNTLSEFSPAPLLKDLEFLNNVPQGNVLIEFIKSVAAPVRSVTLATIKPQDAGAVDRLQKILDALKSISMESQGNVRQLNDSEKRLLLETVGSLDGYDEVIFLFDVVVKQ